MRQRKMYLPPEAGWTIKEAGRAWGISDAAARARIHKMWDAGDADQGVKWASYSVRSRGSYVSYRHVDRLVDAIFPIGTQTL